MTANVTKNKNNAFIRNLAFTLMTPTLAVQLSIIFNFSSWKKEKKSHVFQNNL